VIITPQAVATDGVLSDVSTAAVTVTTTIESLQLQLEPNKEEISALNSTRQNMVILDDGATLDIAAISVNNGSNPRPLKTLALAYDYFKAVWVEGTGGSQKTNTFYGGRGPYSDGFQGKGKQIANFQLGPCDIGSAQISIA
jgi:hypothetical protein